MTHILYTYIEKLSNQTFPFDISAEVLYTYIENLHEVNPWPTN